MGDKLSCETGPIPTAPGGWGLRNPEPKGPGQRRTIFSQATGAGGWALSYGVSKAGLHRIVEQLVVEHPDYGVRFLNVQPGFVATERVLAAGAKLQFVADHAAPVEVIGQALARIVDAAGDFPQGANVQIQDIARTWGLLP